MIDILIGIFGIILTLSTLTFVYKKISNKQVVFNKIIILYTIICSLLFYIFSQFGNGILTNLLTIIYLYFIIGAISDQNKKNRVNYAIIIWLYGILADLLIMLIISITKMSTFFMSINLVYAKTISTVIMVIILLIMSYIPAVKKLTQHLINLFQKLKIVFIVDVLIITILIYLSIICAKDIHTVSKLAFYIFVALSILLILYLSADKYFSLKKYKEINQNLIKNNEFFIKVDNDYRILKHNLTNQLLGIKSVSNDKAKKLIDNLIKKYNSGFIASTDIYKVPTGINGMVYEKFYTGNNKDLNLSVNNNIKTEFLDNLKPKIFNDLSETLGVILDNALEASKHSVEKVILINFDETETAYIIEINNTFNNELDLDSLGTKNYSTKNKKGGIGLFSILGQKNIKVKNSVKNGVYQSKIIVKKSN